MNPINHFLRPLAPLTILAAVLLIPAPAQTAEPVDWSGPDGLVYPNWSQAGVFQDPLEMQRRGIPQDLPVRVQLPASLAGKDQAEAFITALEKAIRDAASQGGGVVALPAGVHLRFPGNR
jgi:hypothetical protein